MALKRSEDSGLLSLLRSHSTHSASFSVSIGESLSHAHRHIELLLTNGNPAFYINKVVAPWNQTLAQALEVRSQSGSVH